MLTCQQLIDFLADYQSGELPDDQRAVFEQHLRLCPPCLKYMDTYSETVELAKEACKCDESTPPRMPEALVQAILKACDESCCPDKAESGSSEVGGCDGDGQSGELGESD